MSEASRDDPRAPGTTTIAPNVLVTIARLTSLGVPGVAGMASIPGGVNRLFRRGFGQGVRIVVDQNVVSAELHLVLQHGVKVREVSQQVQAEVSRAIADMVGMQVGEINVHVEEIALQGPDAADQP